ncbi:MAG: GNAT family N-acetyltransferase [Verrucomicrobiota bacterium]|nr:GNAT family N-acetyltransferase [Verrucomicrobiota bacterium]
MKLRAATELDLQEILDIYNHAVLNTTATYDYEPRTMQHRQEWYREHLRTGFPVLVVEEERGGVLGWASLSAYHLRPGYRFTCENSIYVHHEHRGKGIGKLLLNALIAEAKRLKQHAIIAAIDAQNAVSIHLHATHGFEKVGQFKEIGFKFNRWLDVTYMELLLPHGKSEGTHHP